MSAKTNMLPKTDRYFCDIVARDRGRTTPTSALEQFIVDDMAHRLVLRPHELDVVLLPNLYGDVLSDEGAATIGGMGLAPSWLLRATPTPTSSRPTGPRPTSPAATSSTRPRACSLR